MLGLPISRREPGRVLEQDPGLVARARAAENLGVLDGEQMVEGDQGLERGLRIAPRQQDQGLAVGLEHEPGDALLERLDRELHQAAELQEAVVSGR